MGIAILKPITEGAALPVRIEELDEAVPQRNRELVVYARHVLDALDAFEEHHRRYVAAQAVAGIKPAGEQERTFYETLSGVRQEVLNTLELTIEDLRHKGDKYYEKHFKDGVE